MTTFPKSNPKSKSYVDHSMGFKKLDQQEIDNTETEKHKRTSSARNDIEVFSKRKKRLKTPLIGKKHEANQSEVRVIISYLKSFRNLQAGKE